MTTSTPLKYGIILGSTRQGRRSAGVAAWIQQQIQPPHSSEIIDLKDYPMPFFGEELPSDEQATAQKHIQAWRSKIAEFDGFLFIVPEYNHAPTAVLKNAIDHLKEPLVNKAAALISYGSTGGVRAAEHMRLILAEMQVATVRQQAAFSLFTDFKETEFTPAELHHSSVSLMLQQLEHWALAMRWLRQTIEQEHQEN